MLLPGYSCTQMHVTVTNRCGRVHAKAMVVMVEHTHAKVNSKHSKVSSKQNTALYWTVCICAPDALEANKQYVHLPQPPTMQLSCPLWNCFLFSGGTIQNNFAHTRKHVGPCYPQQRHVVVTEVAFQQQIQTGISVDVADHFLERGFP